MKLPQSFLTFSQPWAITLKILISLEYQPPTTSYVETPPPPIAINPEELVIGLVSNIELLSEEQLNYVLNRISAEKQRRTHSCAARKQSPCIEQQTVKLSNTSLVPEKQPDSSIPATQPNFKSLINFFDKASLHIQKPTVQIALNGHSLCIARNSSKYAGALNLNDWDGNWHGRINTDGSLFKARDWQDWVMAILEEFAAEPSAIASQHGKTTGCCCFCNKPLTDPQSVAIGYGAICAKHFGLPYPLQVNREQRTEYPALTVEEIKPDVGQTVEIISERHGSEYVWKKGTVLTTSTVGCSR